MSSSKPALCLFDVDGTLTPSRRDISEEMLTFLSTRVKPLCKLAVVGGSDFVKIAEQLKNRQDDLFEYVFSENGLVARKGGKEIASQSIHRFLGEEVTQRVINFCLHYIADLKLPAKRGTFIEFRTGLINVSPVGRSCSQAERDEFVKFDTEHGIRSAFIAKLREAFSDLNLCFSIGGQISIDIFPVNWDKTYCLQFLDDYSNIHFFGDKTLPGGNDHEIFSHPRVTGHTVTDPEDTMNQLQVLFSL